MARSFNGTSDFIAIGSSGALDQTFPMVVAALIYTNGTGCIVGKFQITGGFTAGWALQVNASNKIRFTKPGVVDIDSSAITLSTGHWYLIGAYVTSTNVRFFAYDYAADSFAAENVSDSSAFRSFNNTTAAHIGKFVGGSGQNVAFFPGDIEIAAAWIGNSVAPTDDQLHNLAFDRAALFEFGNPSALWALDQQSTSQKVVDEQQNANESSISGTSVSTRSVPLWTPGVAPVSDAGEAATVDTPFIASTTTIFAPTVDPSGAATVTVPFIASVTTAFAPTVASESIQAPFISATTTVFAPTVTSSAATIDLPFISSTTSIFSPTLVHLDTTPPVLKLVGAYRSKITLVYDEAVDPATPLTSEFAVTVNGIANTVTGVAVAGSTVTLTLTTPVSAGNRVHVTYAP